VPVHEALEPLAVVRLKKVNHLMEHHIVQKLRGTLGEFRIEADGSGIMGASSPSGLHLLNKEGLGLHAKDALPFLDKRLGSLPEQAPIPLVHELPNLLRTGTGANPHSQHSVGSLNLLRLL